MHLQVPFAMVDDMLMRVYYLYEKSPKKCVEKLKQCLENVNLPEETGLCKPVGLALLLTRWLPLDA